MEKLWVQVNMVTKNGGTGVRQGCKSAAKVLNFWKDKRKRESAL